MNKFIVSYDLRSPQRDYTSLIAAIKTADKWAKPLESTWVIWTPKTAAQVLAVLRQCIDSNDGLLVIKLSDEKDGAWVGINGQAANFMTANW